MCLDTIVEEVMENAPELPLGWKNGLVRKLVEFVWEWKLRKECQYRYGVDNEEHINEWKRVETSTLYDSLESKFVWSLHSVWKLGDPDYPDLKGSFVDYFPKIKIMLEEQIRTHGGIGVDHEFVL